MTATKMFAAWIAALSRATDRYNRLKKLNMNQLEFN